LSYIWFKRFTKMKQK